MSDRVVATGRGRDLAQLTAARHRLAESVVTKTVSFSAVPPTRDDLTCAISDLKHLAWAMGADWAACEGRAEELFQQEIR